MIFCVNQTMTGSCRVHSPQPGPESEGVYFVEKGWVTYSGQEVWYVLCDSHPEIIKNLPKSKYTLCEVLSMPWL